VDNLFSAEQLEFLKSKFVEKDACSVRHEKTDEKINTLIVDSSQTKVKLSLIQWIVTTAAGASIASLIAGLYSAIFK
jgi:hypothetical protein